MCSCLYQRVLHLLLQHRGRKDGVAASLLHQEVSNQVLETASFCSRTLSLKHQWLLRLKVSSSLYLHTLKACLPQRRVSQHRSLPLQYLLQLSNSTRPLSFLSYPSTSLATRNSSSGMYSFCFIISLQSC